MSPFFACYYDTVGFFEISFSCHIETMCVSIPLPLLFISGILALDDSLRSNLDDWLPTSCMKESWLSRASETWFIPARRLLHDFVYPHSHLGLQGEVIVLTKKRCYSAHGKACTECVVYHINHKSHEGRKVSKAGILIIRRRTIKDTNWRTKDLNSNARRAKLIPDWLGLLKIGSSLQIHIR